MSIETNVGTDAPTEGAATESVNTGEALNAIVEAASPAESKAPPITEPANAEEVLAKPDPQAAKFAALSRKEKALKLQERQLQQKLAELEAREKAATGQVDETKYINVEAFKRNPYQYMQKHGLTLEQVAEIALNDGKITPEKLVAETETKLEKKIRELEDKLAAKEADEAQKNVQKTIEEFRSNLNKFVLETPDYEMIQAEGEDGVNLVFEVIEAHFDRQKAKYIEENGEEPDVETQHGFIMSNKEASDRVEAYLLDQEKQRIERAKKLKKTQGLLQPQTPSQEKKVESQNSTTLTNTMAAAVPKSGSKMLTDEESKREAAKLIKWNN